MSTNEIFAPLATLQLAATHPTTPVSGDPARFGEMPLVCVVSESATTSRGTFARGGVYTLSVKGVDGGGNAAVAAGDILYYVDADTPVLSKKTAGHRFGIALEAVNSGATATIRVAVDY